MSMRENTNEMYHIKGCNSSSLSKHDLGPYISNYTIINLLINLSFIIWGFFPINTAGNFQCTNCYNVLIRTLQSWLSEVHTWNRATFGAVVSGAQNLIERKHELGEPFLVLLGWIQVPSSTTMTRK